MKNDSDCWSPEVHLKVAYLCPLHAIQNSRETPSSYTINSTPAKIGCSQAIFHVVKEQAMVDHYQEGNMDDSKKG